MKTRTVAYATQMVSSVAVMIGARRQLSLRRVRSGICARVLAGAWLTCVIGDVSALELRGVLPRLPAAPAPACALHWKLYSNAYHHKARWRRPLRVTLATPHLYPGAGAAQRSLRFMWY